MKRRVFDKHFEDRGIWVYTRRAWYKLKQPCRRSILLSNGTETSQEIVHQEFRAKCSLLSNLLDMMSDDNGYLSTPFVMFHATKTPSESHSALKLDVNELQTAGNFCTEPFDCKLLKRDPQFIRMQLQGTDHNLSQKCNFIMGLRVMQKDLRKAKANNDKSLETSFCFGTSAEEAEFRSNRYPWGCPKRDENGMFFYPLIVLTCACVMIFL